MTVGPPIQLPALKPATTSLMMVVQVKSDTPVGTLPATVLLYYLSFVP